MLPASRQCRRLCFSLAVILGTGLLRAGTVWGAESGAANPPPLRWAADAEGGAPYIFKDPKNPEKYVGFEVDLAEQLEKELGRRIEFQQYEFRSLVPGLERGDFEIAMNGLEITPDRRKVILFSRPYYIYALQLVARADEKRFRALEECRKEKLLAGTLEDTAAARLLDQMGIAKKLYNSQVEPYLDLQLGRIDAVLLDLPIAVYYARPNPKLKFVGPQLGEGYYAIGFRKDQQALAAKFDIALDHIFESGQLRKIYEKWGIWNEDQTKLFTGEKIPDVLKESSRLWTFSVYFPMLLKGAIATVTLTLLSMMLAVAIGLPLALSRLYGPAPLRAAATLYVEFFRGIPVLLLLFLIYYSLPGIAARYDLPFSLRLPAFCAAILGFGLNYAAYEAEIYRDGIRSIPVGQWEAAASLGMSPLLTFRRIILPQAVRVILPPMTNDLVALFKDTSVVSIIAVDELTKEYQILSKSSLKYLEIGLATAMLYLIMSVPLGYLSRYLEKKWGRGL